MYPHLFKIPTPWGDWQVATYGFSIMIGFLLCLYLAGRRAPRLGIKPNDIFDVAVAMLLGGIVGARLFYVVEFWEEGGFGENPAEILRLDKGGLVFYGGLMGGAVMLLIMIFIKRLLVRRTLDLVMSLVPLGHVFGRLGCFFNGCCFGRITHGWLGVRFPRGSPPFRYHFDNGWIERSAAWSEPVHATQLYAVGYNLLLFLFLSWWLCRRRRDGEIAWLYAVFYGSARYVNEIYRVTPPLLFGLSVAQLICVPLIVFGFVMLVRDHLRPPEPLPRPLPEPEGQ